MFQVDPDMVMLATGRKKDPKNLGPERFKKNKARKGASGEEAEEAASEQEAEAAAGESEEQAAEAQEQDPDTTDAPEPEKADLAPTRRQIQDLVKYAKEVIAETDLSAAQKQKLRAFMRQAKPLLARAGRANAEPSDIADELSRMVGDLKLSSSSKPSSPTQGTQQQSQQQQDGEATTTTNTSIEDLTGDERRALERLIREEEENPHDPSKPYLTPWRPRDYMSPFAFIPRYLEVNQNVCAAVYLRHPVARVGNAEVPTPYPYEINQLAYNWYLRRR
ncbi:hypothetical protein DL765_008322 [Monosporascus sp. GIB2]|nr:hypothetical protein DL765_008322 [Monosporascus sp. GIB2]